MCITANTESDWLSSLLLKANSTLARMLSLHQLPPDGHPKCSLHSSSRWHTAPLFYGHPHLSLSSWIQLQPHPMGRVSWHSIQKAHFLFWTLVLWGHSFSFLSHGITITCYYWVISSRIIISHGSNVVAGGNTERWQLKLKAWDSLKSSVHSAKSYSEKNLAR